MQSRSSGMQWGAVVVAGGRGRRAGEGPPKQFREVAGRPLLLHPVAYFAERCPGPVVVVLPPDAVAAFPDLLERHGLGRRHGAGPGRVIAVAGGAERVESVAAGLAGLVRPDAEPPAWVLVHDAARPVVRDTVVKALLARLAEGFGAAVPVLPVAWPDTVLTVDGRGAATGYPDRAALRRVQTPQAFRRELLEQALARRALAAAPTDESQLVFALGHPVATVPGDEAMLKVTVAADFDRVASLLETEPR